jgi:hypothetical protein
MPMMPSRFAGDSPAEHPGRRPAGPAPFGNDARALGDPPRGGEDQRHRHVGGVFGQDAWSVGDGDAAPQRRGDVNMIDAIAEIGDQLHLLAGLSDHAGVDDVGDGGNEHVGFAHRVDNVALAHRLVVEVETSVEQFAHPRLDQIGELTGDDNQGLLLRHQALSSPPFPPRAAARQISTTFVRNSKCLNVPFTARRANEESPACTRGPTIAPSVAAASLADGGAKTRTPASRLRVGGA